MSRFKKKKEEIVMEKAGASALSWSGDPRMSDSCPKQNTHFLAACLLATTLHMVDLELN